MMEYNFTKQGYQIRLEDFFGNLFIEIWHLSIHLFPTQSLVHYL